MKDDSVFPDAVYKDTVLRPLFEGVKSHYAGPINAINRAHLVMLVETGILGAARAADIAHALNEIEENTDLASLEYDGEFEDYFFFVEAQLAEKLGGDLAGTLHTARSRNDMDHTVFKLVLTQYLDELLTLGQGLLGAIIETADREKSTIIVAYTHGQPAQPTTFGHYLAAVIEVLLRDLMRLQQGRVGLEKCPMGAAAITTSGFPVDRFRMAELLGFRAPLQNSYGCIAGVDYVTGLYCAVKLLFLNLGRVVQDFSFWSSFEVGQLYVPNSFVQISSIMPQKRNPVPLEHLRLLSSLTMGRADMVVNTMHNTPFTDMNDSEGEVQQSGYSAFESGFRMLKLLTALVPKLSIQKKNVQRNLEKSAVTVTELADTLVRLEGLPFRQAHAIAGETARAVLALSAPLDGGFLAFGQAFEKETGRKSTLDEATFREAVSAENFIAVRDRFGGPALGAMDAALFGYRDELAQMENQAKKNLDHRVQSEKKLGQAFAGLTTKTKGS